MNNSEVSYTTEYILGLVGGILGVISSVILFFMASADRWSNNTWLSILDVSSFFSLAASIAAIVSVAIIKTKSRLASIILMVSAVVGLSAGAVIFFLIPGILLFLGGLLAIMKVNKIDTQKSAF